MVEAESIFKKWWKADVYFELYNLSPALISDALARLKPVASPDEWAEINGVALALSEASECVAKNDADGARRNGILAGLGFYKIISEIGGRNRHGGALPRVVKINGVETSPWEWVREVYKKYPKATKEKIFRLAREK